MATKLTPLVSRSMRFRTAPPVPDESAGAAEEQQPIGLLVPGAWVHISPTSSAESAFRYVLTGGVRVVAVTPGGVTVTVTGSASRITKTVFVPWTSIAYVTD